MAQDSATVVLGGTGSTPHLQTVIDGISDVLSSGNTLLLYVTVNQLRGQRGKILVESFVDGKKVWEEETRGSLMAASAEGEVRGMLKSINEKIRKHINGPGLPK